MDNLFNCRFENENQVYYLTYKDIFHRFTVNYWNLVLKYHLKQMRPDGKSVVSKIESILLEQVTVNEAIKSLEFSSLKDTDQTDIVKKVSEACRHNVVGALYNDMDGKLYGFDLKGSGIYIAESGYNFMLKFKAELEKLNYYAWAKFMEKINDDSVLVRLLDKLELATPRRDNLSVYRDILYREFEECNCFYCGKKLGFDGKGTHVDHFIPWSYVKDDKLWNFVLSCPRCNEKKNNKIPAERYLEFVLDRNEKIKASSNEIVKIDFECYNPEQFLRIWKYAQLSGMKQFASL